MHKKLTVLLVLVCSLFLVTGCGKKEEQLVNPDAAKFKEDYEKLNGETNTNGKIIRSIKISDKNPFVYKTAEELVEAINNKESFVVYFGFNSCPWCRSMIETFINVLDEENVKEVYYVDILNIRDTLEVNSKGKVVTKVEGSEGYMELIKLLDNVLSDYSLTDSEGKAVETKEKRIYAPNVVIVKDGVAVGLESGISDLQNDSYMDLTQEIKDDMYNKLKTFFTNNY